MQNKQIKQITCNHKAKTQSYLSWHNFAEKQANKGRKQKQCKVCKLWFFNSEF